MKTGVVSSLAAALFLSAGGAMGQAQAPPPAAKAPAPAKAPKAASFESLSDKAKAAREAGRVDEAIGLYRQALKLEPEWWPGRFSLGTLLFDDNRFEEARSEFRRLVLAQPKDGVVLALRGLCEFNLKNYERALGDLMGARELGIANEELFGVAQFHAAILLNRFERFESAFDVLRDFALRDRDTQPVIEAFGLSVLRLPYLPAEAPTDRREAILMAGRAGFYQSKGQSNTRARMAFEELISRFPTLPNAHYAFGIFLLVENPDAALEEFRRELRSNPNHTHATLQIAYEQIKRGEFAEARTLAEKGVELAPRLFAAHHALGRALLELGDVDGAIKELEIGASLAPDSPEVFFALARAYARQERTEDAARARATFLKLDRARRAAKTGPQSVGGQLPPPEDAPREKP
jgi:tetratricopeptide (TPR) repeat protein